MADPTTAPYDADLLPDLDDGDGDNPEGKAHVVARAGALSAGALVSYAYEHQLTLTALCGYKWIPKLNPEKVPLCRKCAELGMSYNDNAGD
jgi:hypothetical protein